MRKRYEKYRPSGIEWIGEIPEHWELSKLKYAAHEGTDNFQDGDWIESNVIVEDGEYRYITTGNIGEGKYKEQGRSFITQETFDKLECLEIFPGDLLISRLNPPIGRSCIVPELGFKIVTSVDNVVLRPKESFDKKYLMYVTNSEHYYEYTGLIARGATMSRISRTLLGVVEIPFPPKKEQIIIANYLDKKTLEIDDFISKKQKLIELLKEERITIINKAVSGEGKKWERKKLKYVALKVQTGSTPPTNLGEYYNDEVNWFTPSDFSDKLLLKNSKRKISAKAISDGIIKAFPANSVLMVAIGATLGRVGYIEESATSNQQINAISFDKLNKAKFYADYFYANQQHVASLANSATLAILNQAQTKDIVVPVPRSEKELFDISNYIEIETKKIDATISKIEKEIELMREYRAILISEVVTGKIKVI